MLDTWTYINNDWFAGATPLMFATTNAAWLGNTVFDGARRYDGVFPDLALHCQRVVRSAEIMGMMPTYDADTIETLARDGAKKFASDAALYIRPMFWIEDGLGPIDPTSTRFALVIQVMPMPDVSQGFSACISPLRKPLPETAPTTAKASCLYPQLTRAWGEARKRGFDNAVMLDARGDVAEFTMQNLLLVMDNEIHTPVPNNMLLPGITRARALGLLRDMGLPIVERKILPDELSTADEVISTGNHARIHPCSRLEETHYGVGNIGKKLISKYRDFAHQSTKAL